MCEKRILATCVLACLLISGGCQNTDPSEDRLKMGFAELCEALLEKQNTVSEQRVVDESMTPVYAEDVTHEGTEAGGYREIDIIDNDEPFSFELRGASLAAAFDMIAETGGVNFLLNGDFSEMVELSLVKVTINQALSALCSAHDCEISQSGAVFVVSKEDARELLTRIFRLNSISASGQEAHLKEMIGSGGAVIVNDQSDVITITSTRNKLDDVEAYLRSVDQCEKQVLIEAKVIEFSLTDLYELGSELDLSNIHIDEATASVLSSLLTDSRDVTLEVSGDKADIDGAFNILSKLTTVNVISHPNVMAKDNELATIDIIKEVPYIESTITTTGDTGAGLGSSSVESVEFKEVGIKLQVTPSIMSDGTVSLAIDQDVSEQVDTFNGVPVVNHRHIVTQFVVDDRKAILIGGLLKESFKDEVKGIPLLMDLPLLGFLFRGTTRVKEKVELVVMITPTIVDAKGGKAVESQYRFPEISKSESGGRNTAGSEKVTYDESGPGWLPTITVEEDGVLVLEDRG